MVGWRRKFLSCRCSETNSELILSLFLRVKILHLAHCKFFFLLFRRHYRFLFSRFNGANLAVTKLQKHRRMFVLRFEQHGPNSSVPSASILRKAAVGTILNKQMHPSRDVPRKKCSENMQQIYSRAPLPNISHWHWRSPVNLIHIFRTPFLRTHLDFCFWTRR